MFHKLWRTKSQNSVHRLQLLKRKESQSVFKPVPSAYQHNALPLGQTGSQRGSTIQSSLKGRERVCQSDKHRNHFKGNSGETSERQGGAYTGFSTERGSFPTTQIPSWTEPFKWTELKCCVKVINNNNHSECQWVLVLLLASWQSYDSNVLMTRQLLQCQWHFCFGIWFWIFLQHLMIV